jgi:small subunit ribosomal protein S21
MNAGAGAVDIDFTMGTATNRADFLTLGRTESLGGTFRAQRTARHTAQSISPENLRLTLPSAVRIIDRLYRGWGVYLVAEVRIQDGESIENALRRFKRKVQQEDIIKEVKKHSFYLKPGEKKRIKQALARKRSRKKVRRVVED